jgi:ATP-dependent Clp protease ATP-binding subunit ClpA
VHDWLLARAGADAGARPLRRAVQRHLEDAVSDYLIHHREGRESLLAAVEDERLVVTAREGVCS